MLVLTRKAGQSLTIGDDIKVTLLSITGDRVSIGVDAPNSVRIFRSELLEQARTANREALASAPGALMTLRKAQTGGGQ
jgi:carbon storage regulator